MMNTQIPAQTALAILIILIIVMVILIVWRRIATKPWREKMRARWDAAAPERHPTPLKAEVQAPDTTLNMLQADPKHCPFCRGDIEPGVLKCKHCGEWLEPTKRKEQDVVKKAQLETAKTSKSTNQAIGWIVFIIFGIPALVAILKGC